MKKTIPFNEVIQGIMINFNLNQQQLAEKIGTTQTTVSRWLAGTQQPLLEQLQSIAINLGVDPAEVLGLKEF